MPRKTLRDMNDPIAVAYRQYEDQAEKLAELDKKVDLMMSDKTSDGLKKGVTMDDFNKALSATRRQAIVMFGALDKWRYLVEHKDDPSTEPAVPVAEVSAVIGMSLSDKLEGLEFSVNYGLLASKVANAIKMDVQEGGAGDVPLCSDCG